MQLIERKEKGADREPLDYPLDPEFLRASGQIHTRISEGGFSPEAIRNGGEHIFRLTTNRGTWGQNLQSGLLKLSGSPLENEKQVIDFRQISVDGGSTNRGGMYLPYEALFQVKGTMTCEEGKVLSWELESEAFQTASIGALPVGKTRHRETGRVMDHALEVVIDGRTYTRKRDRAPFMTEWNLLTLVLDLPFDSGANFKLCLFEGLSLQKPDCRLVYTGRHDAPHFGGTLHSFSLIGRGIVPLDYWLDSDHRLVCCVSGGLGRGFIPEGLMLPPMLDFAQHLFSS